MPKEPFEVWKYTVNRIVENITGMSCDDLPDWDYWRAWESNMRPLTAAKKVIKAAKDF